MAGMGGPTSRFCHETAKQQISGEAVKCRRGDAGNRETNAQPPNAEYRTSNAGGERGARSGECWSGRALRRGVVGRPRSTRQEPGDREQRAETKTEAPTPNA